MYQIIEKYIYKKVALKWDLKIDMSKCFTDKNKLLHLSKLVNSGACLLVFLYIDAIGTYFFTICFLISATL